MTAHPLRNLILTTAFVLPTAAQPAVSIPREGGFDYNFCMAGKFDHIELKPGLAIGNWELGAGTYANGASKAFDRMGGRCVGVYEIVEGTYQDRHVCTMVDADGDKWLLRGETRANGSGQWVAVGGTGKYEGMAASGSFAEVDKAPPGNAPTAFNKCNRNTGTYKLR